MDDDDLVKDFMVESHENLDQLDQDLVALEADPTNPEMLSRIFRTIHTIKGTCGFLGFNKLESVTHVGENLLSQLRDGELPLNDEITTALLSLVDAVRNETQPTYGPYQGRLDQELILAIRMSSINAGAPVKLPIDPGSQTI